MPSVSRGALWTVYLVMMMDTLNFGVVLPLLPSIAKDFGAGATMASLMTTSYSFCQMAATPILGRISDRVGRRPVILISLLGTALSSFGTALSWNFPLLVISRCLNGISGATPGVVNAYIADVTTKEEKPEYMAYASVANAVGIIVGPALGGLLSHYGFATACSVSGVLSSLNLLVALLILKESRWEQARDITVSLRKSPIGGVHEDEAASQGSAGARRPEGGVGRCDALTADPRQQASGSSGEDVPGIPCAAWFLFAVGFFLMLGFAAVESIVPYFLMDRFFDGDANRAGQYCGIVYTMVGIEILIMGGLVYKRAVKLLGMQLVVLIGAIVRTACFFMQAYAPTFTLFGVSVIICDAGSQFIFPTATALLTTMCHRSAYGRALGYYQGMQAFSRVLGPAVFGWGYDHLTHEFSFLACGATTVIAAICFFFAHAFQPVAQPLPPPSDLERVEGGLAPARSLDGDQVPWRSPPLPEAPRDLESIKCDGARDSASSGAVGSDSTASERGEAAAERACSSDLESSCDAQSCVSTTSEWTDASSTAS